MPFTNHYEMKGRGDQYALEAGYSRVLDVLSTLIIHGLAGEIQSHSPAKRFISFQDCPTKGLLTTIHFCTVSKQERIDGGEKCCIAIRGEGINVFAVFYDIQDFLFGIYLEKEVYCVNQICCTEH